MEEDGVVGVKIKVEATMEKLVTMTDQLVEHDGKWYRRRQIGGVIVEDWKEIPLAVINPYTEWIKLEKVMTRDECRALYGLTDKELNRKLLTA